MRLEKRNMWRNCGGDGERAEKGGGSKEEMKKGRKEGREGFQEKDMERREGCFDSGKSFYEKSLKICVRRVVCVCAREKE